ncbi:MAG: GntR family transcriptional regulator [Lachnospiraceae bacterium]|nr:GntR family transcriptional regulator [Lachnospiraceae bacterium]
MTQHVKNKSLRQTAYEYIKRKILSCEYEPGMFLNEQQICDEMGGISRTPVRDALGRLEQEGLLNIIPKKGIMVSDLKLNDINSIYEVRLLLEPYVLRRYGSRLDPVKLKRFEEIMSDPGRASSDSQYYFFDLDDQFHGFIMYSMKNRYLNDAYSNIYNMNQRIRVLSGTNVQNRIAATFAEHLEIVEACLAKDWEKAALSMSSHLRNSMTATFQMITENAQKF